MDKKTQRQDTAISQVMEKMTVFLKGNIRDIQHFMMVWGYSRMIGEAEGLDPETLFTLETAAIVHDIACPLCREKYGSAVPKHQEREGALMVRSFLEELGMDEERIGRISFLVGHHHTFSMIDGVDYQILVEADYIVNASEKGWERNNIQNFMDKIAKTAAGKRLIAETFCL